MSQLSVRNVLVLALAFAAMTVCAQTVDRADIARAKEIAGKYRAVEINDDNGKGFGVVTIEWLEANKVKFHSNYGAAKGQGTNDIGIGTVTGNTLSVKYRGEFATKRMGEAEYTIRPNGVLDGWWHYGKDKKRPEKLFPK